MKRILAIDTETTGTDFYHGCRPFMVTMCDGDANYWWTGSVNPYSREVFWTDEDIAEIQNMVDSYDLFVMQNAQFDMKALSVLGATTDENKGVLKLHSIWDKLDDTMLMAHCIHSAHEDKTKKKPVGRSLKLKDLSIEYLQYWDDDEKDLEVAVKAARASAALNGYTIAKHGHRHFPAMPKNNQFWKQDYWLVMDECLKYGSMDAERTFLLHNAFLYGLKADSLYPVYKLRRELLKICFDITEAGMNLYQEKAETYLTNLRRKTVLIRKSIEREMGIKYKFNWNTKQHLISLIHHHLQIPVKHHTKTWDYREHGNDPSYAATDKDSLKDYFESYPSKTLRALAKGRSLESEDKYVKSYVAWEHNSSIHSWLNITGTRETRQSSSGPNQQNISAKLQRLFGPSPGNIWIEADFANIELRIWAFASNNLELIEAFRLGKSVHMMIMDVLYPSEAKRLRKDPENLQLRALYTEIKSGTFAIIYGATAEKADETYGYEGATAKIYKRFPGIQEYNEKLQRECWANLETYKMFSVITLGGYRLDVPIDEPFKVCNFYIQGSAGIFMTRSMIALSKNKAYLESESRMINQVHDSLKIQIPIHQKIRKSIHSMLDSIETASMDIFRETPVGWKYKINPADINHPYLIDLNPKIGEE